MEKLRMWFIEKCKKKGASGAARPELSLVRCGVTAADASWGAAF